MYHDGTQAKCAARVCAATPYDAIRIAGYQPYAIQRHAQPLVDQLRETGFVPLPLRAGADNNLNHAFGFDGHFGPFSRLAGRGVDIVGDANAATFAQSRGRGTAGGEAGPVAQS